MGNEKFYMDGCSCQRPRQMSVVHCISSIFVVLLLGICNVPYGSSVPHLSSVLENGDDVPGLPMKPIPRGPTVAPVPSPETLKHLEMLSRREGDESFFSPSEAIKSLFSSSSSSSHPGKGLKRMSQFHGSSRDLGLLGTGGYRRPYIPETLEYDENGVMAMDENGQPTFVPFIGARALTNIPQFFEHLKENIEALKLSPQFDGDESGSSEGVNDSNGGGSEDDDLEFEERPPKKDITRPAARRMKTEFHVDENPDTITKQNWKPRAAGIIHYYAPKENFLQPHQNILRRANNYNPAWLYTNLGLGKRRRR